jgi:hypothetical protein
MMPGLKNSYVPALKNGIDSVKSELFQLNTDKMYFSVAKTRITVSHNIVYQALNPVRVTN